nr:DUF6804 family protein [Frondihabitans sucicola]
MALVGTGDLDYGYYIVLRWALLGVAIVLAIYARKSRRTGWVVTAAVIAAIWFPVRFFELPQGTWVWLDVAAAIAVLVGGFSLPAPRYREDDMGKPVVRWKWWMTTALVAGIIAVMTWFALQPRGADCDNYVDADDGTSYCVD